MAVELLRGLVILLLGLVLLAFGTRIMITGRMRVRKSRPQDAASVQRNSVFVGGAARRRAAFFLALGIGLATLGASDVVKGM